MAPVEQSEVVYYALKHHSLKDVERAEIERKTAEFLKQKQIEVVPFGKCGKPEADPAIDLKTKKAFCNEVNIAGQKFGSLTAISRCPTRAMAAYWVFQCDCGYRGTFQRKKVMDGSRTECDTCKAKKKAPKKPKDVDLTGKRFNKLKVLKRANYRKNNSTCWVCQCDCGGTRDVKTFELTSGVVKNCKSCTTETFKKRRRIEYGGRNG